MNNFPALPIKSLLIIFLSACCMLNGYSQESRIRNNNKIGWLGYYGTFKTGPHVSIYTEYQVRRVEGLKSPMQNLLRVGINYQTKQDIIWHLGYSHFKVYPYGEYPTLPAGTQSPEHRIYQQFTLKNNYGKGSFSHRFRLEQRWIGKINPNSPYEVENWVYQNRIRYQIRYALPILRIKETGLYGVIFDEIFIGFGKNIGANVFDQNRLGILIGSKLTKSVSLEAGYLYQILQQNSRINNNPVFQYNKGFLASIILNTDLYKSHKEN